MNEIIEGKECSCQRFFYLDYTIDSYFYIFYGLNNKNNFLINGILKYLDSGDFLLLENCNRILIRDSFDSFCNNAGIRNENDRKKLVDEIENIDKGFVNVNLCKLCGKIWVKTDRILEKKTDE